MAFECQPVQGLHKRFDIYLVQWRLLVEVDGPQHFQGHYHGTDATVQNAWDRHVDAVCQQQGQRLVRLHYMDRREWASTVQAALTSKSTVTYTRSYNL